MELTCENRSARENMTPPEPPIKDPSTSWTRTCFKPSQSMSMQSAPLIHFLSVRWKSIKESSSTATLSICLAIKGAMWSAALEPDGIPESALSRKPARGPSVHGLPKFANVMPSISVRPYKLGSGAVSYHG